MEGSDKKALNKRGTSAMTKLQIITKLWSCIYDLLFLTKGTPTKSLEQIEHELDKIEMQCRRYADTDDVESEL